MIDMGLRSGARSLWEDDLLYDYTITVEDREFKVHKVVLASVSEYFRVMFTGSMRESQTDQVELKELSAETFSELLELIYTGDEDIVSRNAIELYPCAAYLGVQSAVRACKRNILNNIDNYNCLHALSLILTYGYPHDAEAVKEFINKNQNVVFGSYPSPKNLTYSALQVIMDIWKGSEWVLFQLFKDWIEVDNENRVKSINDLMNRVRFSLMTPEEVADVKNTSIYQQSRDTWQELVDEAAMYHELPMHSKVLEDSEQTTIRVEAEPVFFTENDNSRGFKTCAALINHMPRQWETHDIEGPKFSTVINGTFHVNNFLICYTELEKGQTEWYIFDARTLKWSEIASMSRPKTDFTLVHHDKHLYVLGGRTDTKALTKTVEQYDFRTNSWKSTRIRLPVATAEVRACVLGDAIYCCGGYVQKKGVPIHSKRMDRLDMLTHKWECRAPMLDNENNCSAMCVMKISGEDVVVFASKYRVDMYNPSTDQWSVWNAATKHFSRLTWNEQSWIMAQKNTVYLFNVIEVSNIKHVMDVNDCFNFVSDRVRCVCVRWRMDEEQDLPHRNIVDDMTIPERESGEPERMFGALLALPYHKLPLS